MTAPHQPVDAEAGAGSGSGLVVNRLTKRFGERTAFSEVSFDVAHGEVFGFLGPNGAGKTTTVRTLGTLIAPTSGTATVAGIPLRPENGVEIRQCISIMPEAPGLYLRLTVTENLELPLHCAGGKLRRALQPPAPGRSRRNAVGFDHQRPLKRQAEGRCSCAFSVGTGRGHASSMAATMAVRTAGSGAGCTATTSVRASSVTAGRCRACVWAVPHVSMPGGAGSSRGRAVSRTGR